jgi:mono/diheme cytochrome c family protein
MSRITRLLVRTLLILVLLLAVAVGGGFAYLFLALPRAAPPSTLKVTSTPEKLERGKYLAHHVVGCTNCHGERDWTKYSAPMMPDREGHGGMEFALGDVGTLRAPNITPAALGDWTDGELLRAMTDGVSKDGRPLFPLMPWPAYQSMAREDAEAIIAYVRALPPVAREVPRSALNFPLNLIVRTIPRPAPPLPERRPDPSDRLAYGKYLATIADCSACHTKMDQGQPLPGMTFAGGNEFKLRNGDTQYSANITPDAETGIGNWTESQFVERFKTIGEAPESELALNGRRNTEMPWRDYGGMTREDLAAIYTYLRTVPAVRNVVPR